MKKIILLLVILISTMKLSAQTVSYAYVVKATTWNFTPPAGSSFLVFDALYAVCEDDCNTYYRFYPSPPIGITPGSSYNSSFTGVSASNWTSPTGTHPSCSNLIIIGALFHTCTAQAVVVQDGGYCNNLHITEPGAIYANPYDCCPGCFPVDCHDMDCYSGTRPFDVTVTVCNTCSPTGGLGTILDVRRN